MIEFKPRSPDWGIFIHDTEHLTKTAEMARNLMYEIVRLDVGKRLQAGMSGEPYEPMKPGNIAKMACDVAEACWAEMKRRELVIDGPTVPDIDKMYELGRKA